MPERQPMSEAMYYILLALLHPSHGYGMMQRIRCMDMGSCSGSGNCPEDGWCWDRGRCTAF